MSKILDFSLVLCNVLFVCFEEPSVECFTYIVHILLVFTKHTIELIARTDYLMANEIEVNTK